MFTFQISLIRTVLKWDKFFPLPVSKLLSKLNHRKIVSRLLFAAAVDSLPKARKVILY